MQDATRVETQKEGVWKRERQRDGEVESTYMSLATDFQRYFHRRVPSQLRMFQNVLREQALRQELPTTPLAIGLLFPPWRIFE